MSHITLRLIQAQISYKNVYNNIEFCYEIKIKIEYN